MSEPFSDLLRKRQARINQCLAALAEKDHNDNSSSTLTDFEDACHYALTAGGKRVRPLLVLMACEAVGSTPGPAAERAACAIELVHTYSLVHDDLPAMDDDDLRRGKPTVHKAYNESTAILVGDALQARAFQLLAQAPELSAEQRVRMTAVLASAAGSRGMVGGQFIDMQATGSAMPLAALQSMHQLKTGALIRAALALGGIVGGASDSELAALDAFGEHTGLAFQIIDDVLDDVVDTAALGKTSGKDKKDNKPTYVSALGLEGAQSAAKKELMLALQAISSFGASADELRALAKFIVERDS